MTCNLLCVNGIMQSNFYFQTNHSRADGFIHREQFSTKKCCVYNVAYKTDP